ncbi:FAD-dependent monooxygenase (plasmid) [Deinococcus sp. KNUC1210]|uniref:FAD-dependent monooxygenase n=1 Tax=Deinococcus sp. KNUC1210 TaxID=2917691 RepID=UPI001EF1450A|nr:FAD-dependent monooxygenase [Deinococcus sp. KNUC1210]ULH17901.1 FAD-dependent monooxygenase [Deinococcus sp. KNUC1210]
MNLISDPTSALTLHRPTKPQTVLISGASIAGPVLAYWLNKFGFDVTVVERSGGPRGSGYPIDVRGPALTVLKHMGLLDEVRQQRLHTRRLSFVDDQGALIGALKMDDAESEGHDIELPRGALTSLLYRQTLGTGVHYRFNDSIETLQQDDVVSVTFQSGEPEHFDLVIGADGMHSHTRELTFGPEMDFSHYLGYCFNGFSMTNLLHLSYEAITHASPGRTAVQFAVDDSDSVHAFLVYASEEPPFTRTPDLSLQRNLVARLFENEGWIVPQMLQDLQNADDLYADVVAQIRMPAWSKGRVVLVGDAAYAPSFLTGQGTSLAMVGAYVLAGELASHPDVQSACVAYEEKMRPYVDANQALVDGGSSLLVPRTAEALKARNQMIAGMDREGTQPATEAQRRAYTALTLPDYQSLLHSTC